MPETTDQAARDRIASDLGSTLFVEAGAGTGKTSALVDRIVALVSAGAAMEQIAAITFTDRAATELRDRVRRRLEDLAGSPGPHAEAAAAALVELDGAALCTLHAFAQRILVDHPVESGLPPAVEVMDEVSSLVDFDERWQSLVGSLLTDPDLAFTMLAGFELGVRLNHIRRLARSLDANWDLVEERLVAAPDPVPVDATALVALLRPVVALGGHCDDADDGMALQLDLVEDLADRLETAADDPLEVIRVLGDRKVVSTSTRLGNKKNWTGEVSVAEVREQMQEARALVDADVDHLTGQVVDRIVGVVGAAALAAAEGRRRQGQLGFHDLLVLARRAMADAGTGPAVRAALNTRYRHLLLDEFQDTDPIQVELAALIADPETITDDWRQLRPPPGSLFFVGDPKQSIYGFRRADIAMYLDSRQAFGSQEVRLEQNFRTTAPVIDWVNAVFSHLIQEAPHAQPAYSPLVATRPAAPVGPSVALLGHGADHRRSASELRDDDVHDVVATVTTALAEGWSVWRPEPGRSDGAWKPCSPGDIAILVRSRRPVARLASALADAGVPHRIETGSNPWTTDEVRDVLTTLRAVDDPTDELALVTALRTPLFGCGDDDLLAFRAAGGRWDHQQPGPSGLPPDHPVVEALCWMARLHADRPWNGAADLAERVVRDRRAMELAVYGQRPRDSWRRIRTFLDTARSFGEARGGDLRAFLEWCRLHATDEVRIDEAIPPEPDDDAVRILTVHSAKGLEFPICVLADLGARRSADGHSVAFPPGDQPGVDPGTGGGIAVAFRKDLANAAHRSHSSAGPDLEHLERLRLLYVGATRARDHLVVSLHRSPTKSDERHPIDLPSAEVLHRAVTQVGLAGATALEPTMRELPVATPPDTTPLPERSTWRSTGRRVRSEGARRHTIAPTTIALEATGTAEEAESARPGEAGRHGAGAGRAVHAALEVADLAGTGVHEARRAADAEGVDADLIAAMVASALASPSVAAAAAGEHWRELYVATPLSEDLLLEGYIDLAYRTDDGLVVVDYKTDAWADPSELDAKVARHRLQGAAYALALERATGQRVSRATFCFLGGLQEGMGAVERHVADLEAAKAEAGALALASVDP